jgi:hypothetical protein
MDAAVAELTAFPLREEPLVFFAAGAAVGVCAAAFLAGAFFFAVALAFTAAFFGAAFFGAAFFGAAFFGAAFFGAAFLAGFFFAVTTLNFHVPKCGKTAIFTPVSLG